MAGKGPDEDRRRLFQHDDATGVLPSANFKTAERTVDERAGSMIAFISKLDHKSALGVENQVPGLRAATWKACQLMQFQHLVQAQ